MANDTDMFSYREDVQTIATIEKIARATEETKSCVMRALVKSGLETSKSLSEIKKATIIRAGMSRDIDDLYENCVLLGDLDVNFLKIDALLTILKQKTHQKITENERNLIRKSLITRLKTIRTIDKAYFEQLKPILRRYKKIEGIEELI